MSYYSLILFVGVPFFHSIKEVELNTVRICRTTHSHPLCVASCVLVTNLVSQMLQVISKHFFYKVKKKLLKCSLTYEYTYCNSYCFNFKCTLFCHFQCLNFKKSVAIFFIKHKRFYES